VLNRTNCERLLLNLREVLEEGAEVIFGLERANCVYYLYLLIVLLLTEATHITRLKEMRLIQRELDNLDLIHLRLNNGVIRVVAGTIN
jgi:hypothetical protein